MPPHVPQVFPVAPATQPRPVAQAMLPLQQGCPMPPQVWHMPVVMVIMSRPVQARPIWQLPLLPPPQQGCPAPPQVPHLLPAGLRRQPSGISHDVPSLQQGWSALPHAWHIPPRP
jgi:hypothetical protein